MTIMPANTAQTLGVSAEDWDSAPVFGTPAKKGTVAQRLIAELATAPEKAPVQEEPRVLTVTISQAAKMLGITRPTVYNFIRAGKLHPQGKDERERTMLDRAEVEALVAERSSASFEKKLAGPAREEHVLARNLGLAPGDKKPDSNGRQEFERELLLILREIKAEISFGLDRIYQRVATHSQVAGLQDSLSALNTGALTAAVAAAITALTPDTIKDDVKRKVTGLVTGAATTVAETTVFAGEQPDKIKSATSQLDAFLDDWRARNGK